MNFNLVEMYNGLLRFNKHILNELAEGLKHLPNLDGVSSGCASDDSAAGSGGFDSLWIRQDASALVGFFTTVKLD